MTEKQKESLELFNFLIKEGRSMISIDRENAIDLKRLMENQAGYIKELEADYRSLQDDFTELQRKCQYQQDCIKQLELEDNIKIEQILDKVRYLCGVENDKYIIGKDDLNILEKRLKGEEL